MEVAIARRLADCALSLLITQDAEDAATAQTLLQAAQYVVGLATAKPSAEAALFTSTPNDRRLKVARDCLPPGVDIIACLRNDRPTTYKPSNIGEEYGTPEAAVRAAWEHHLRLTQSVHERAAHSTGTIRSVTVNGVTQEVKVPVKEGDVISFSEDNKVVVKSRAFKVGDNVRYVRNLDGSTKTPPIGWEGIIESDDGTELPFRVAGPSWPMDDGLPFHFFYPDELDLVTPTA